MSVGAIGSSSGGYSGISNPVVGAMDAAGAQNNDTEAISPGQDGTHEEKINEIEQDKTGGMNNIFALPEMSTQDFASLSSLSDSPMGEEGLSGMKDLKDMMKMVIALQILQKVVEATSEVLDDFISGDDGGGKSGGFSAIA
tara:strand:+ start:832 stop:1254 length:423 start_codon:yes stop_codon:yes gene_type:complete